MYTILAINPGSTSTKVAIYQDDKAVRELTLRHSTEELAPFAGVLDQFDFRKQIILDAMKEAGVTLSDIDAVIGRAHQARQIGRLRSERDDDRRYPSSSGGAACFQPRCASCL